MKITVNQLRRIIVEEAQRALGEAVEALSGPCGSDTPFEVTYSVEYKLFRDGGSWSIKWNGPKAGPPSPVFPTEDSADAWALAVVNRGGAVDYEVVPRLSKTGTKRHVITRSVVDTEYPNDTRPDSVIDVDTFLSDVIASGRDREAAHEVLKLAASTGYASIKICVPEGHSAVSS